MFEKIMSWRVVGFILFLGVLINHVSAESFFVAVDGKNTDSGSFKKPWKDLNIALQKISAGDTIFVRDGIYRTKQLFDGNEGAISGEKENPIVIINYENENPKFYGSLDFDRIELWRNLGDNLWATVESSVESYDVGTIWHDNTAAQRKVTLDSLKNQWDFWFDPVRQLVVVYASKNPAKISKSIEIPVGEPFESIFILKNLHHIIIDGLTIQYANTHGLQMTNVSNVTIRNCTVSYGGGPWIWKNEPVRYGNAIELWCNGHDILIENCTLSYFFDTGITHQGDNGEQYNIVIRNNFIHNNKCGIEHWGTQTINVRDILYENNIIEDSGDNWADNLQNVWGAIRLMRHHPNSKGSHIKNSGIVENFVVRNNIIRRCGSKTGGQFEQESPFYEHPSIRLIGGPYIIENNIIDEGKSLGVYATHNFHGTIKKNIITNCDWEGIHLEEDSKSAVLQENIIKNCNIKNVKIKDE